MKQIDIDKVDERTIIDANTHLRIVSLKKKEQEAYKMGLLYAILLEILIVFAFIVNLVPEWKDLTDMELASFNASMQFVIGLWGLLTFLLFYIGYEMGKKQKEGWNYRKVEYLKEM